MSKYNVIFRQLLILSIILVFLPINSSHAGKKKRLWKQYYLSGVAALKAKNYRQAEQDLQKAIGLADKKFKKKEERAQTYYYFARLKKETKDYRAASEYLQVTLKIRKKNLGESHPKTLLTMDSLANMRIGAGSPQYAEPILDKLMQTRMRQLGSSHKLVLETIARLASVKLTLDKPKEAANLYKRAINISAKSSANAKLTAKLMESYSRALVKSGDHEKAEKINNRVMHMRAKTDSGEDKLAFTATTVSSKKPATRFVEPAGFKRFKAGLIKQKKYNLSEEYQHTLCRDKRLQDSMLHCIVYWFRARDVRQSKNVSSLTVKVLEYKDQNTAIGAKNNVRAAANPNTGINYEWNYLLVQDNRMYWLNAGCSVSQKKWSGLVSSFKNDIGARGNRVSSSLSCRCGGGCR